MFGLRSIAIIFRSRILFSCRIRVQSSSYRSMRLLFPTEAFRRGERERAPEEIEDLISFSRC